MSLQFGNEDVVVKFRIDDSDWNRSLNTLTENLRKKTATSSAAAKKELSSFEKLMAKKVKGYEKEAKLKEKVTAETKKMAAATEKAAKANYKNFQSLKDVQAGYQMVARAIRVVGAATIKAVAQGVKYDRMLVAQTISTVEARVATKGLIDNMMAVQMANMAVAMGSARSNKEFAEQARLATVVAQKLGIDANDAISRVTRGIGKMEVELLDELGIRIRVNEVMDKHAQALGKNEKQLTQAERKTAMLVATMDELRLVAGDSQVNVDNLGSAFEQAKNASSNLYVAIGRLVAISTSGIGPMKELVKWVNDYADAASRITPLKKRQMAERDYIGALEREQERRKSGSFFGDFETSKAGLLVGATTFGASLLPTVAAKLGYKDPVGERIKYGSMSDKEIANEIARAKMRHAGYTEKGEREKRKKGMSQLYDLMGRTADDITQGKKGKGKKAPWLDPNKQYAGADPMGFDYVKKMREKKEKAYRASVAASNKAELALLTLRQEREKEDEQRRKQEDRERDKREKERFQLEMERYAKAKEREKQTGRELTSMPAGGWDIIKKFSGEEGWGQLRGHITRLKDMMMEFGAAGGAAFGAITSSVDILGSALDGLMTSFSSAVFEAITSEKSLAEAFKESFGAWLKTWGQKMMLQSLEYGAAAVGMLVWGNYVGAAQAATSAAMYGAAAVAAGLGANALAPAKAPKKSASRGTSRGLGGTKATAGRASATFVYNINTVIPPDPEDAATTVASFYNKASNMGLIARP